MGLSIIGPFLGPHMRDPIILCPYQVPLMLENSHIDGNSLTFNNASILCFLFLKTSSSKETNTCITYVCVCACTHASSIIC